MHVIEKRPSKQEEETSHDGSCWLIVKLVLGAEPDCSRPCVEPLLTGRWSDLLTRELGRRPKGGGA